MHTNLQVKLNYGSQYGTPELAIYTSDQEEKISKFIMMMVFMKLSAIITSTTLTYMLVIRPKRILKILWSRVVSISFLKIGVLITESDSDWENLLKQMFLWELN